MNRRDFSLITIAYVIVLAVRMLAPSDLATGDQPLQTAYVQDIVQHNAWIVQHDAAGHVASKPPLYNWLAAPLAKLSSAEFVLKLPSIVAGYLTVLIVASLNAGAALLLIASPMFAKHMYFARTDMLLTLFIVAQMWAAARRSQPLFWTAAALAMLTKGPIGIALPAIALSIWWWYRGEFRQRWSEMRVWIGLPLSLLPFAIWFGAALYVDAHDVWNTMVVGETAGRFGASKESRHVLYYVPHLIARMLPVSLIALFAWRDRKKEDVAFAAIWVLSMLAFLSLIPSKRADRLFPLLPAVCLLASHTLRNRRAVIIAITAVMIVAIAIYQFRFRPDVG